VNGGGGGGGGVESDGGRFDSGGFGGSFIGELRTAGDLDLVRHNGERQAPLRSPHDPRRDLALQAVSRSVSQQEITEGFYSRSPRMVYLGLANQKQPAPGPKPKKK
jgi:hypothetical protein